MIEYREDTIFCNPLDYTEVDALMRRCFDDFCQGYFGLQKYGVKVVRDQRIPRGEIIATAPHVIEVGAIKEVRMRLWPQIKLSVN